MSTINNTMLAVKTVVFTKRMPNGSLNFLTVVCAVPENEFGCKLGTDGQGHFVPNSWENHPTIFHASMLVDKMILRAEVKSSLTEYESYLEAIGYSFFTSIKEARRLPVTTAFRMARLYINTVKNVF